MQIEGNFYFSVTNHRTSYDNFEVSFFNDKIYCEFYQEIPVDFMIKNVYKEFRDGNNELLVLNLLLIIDDNMLNGYSVFDFIIRFVTTYFYTWELSLLYSDYEIKNDYNQISNISQPIVSTIPNDKLIQLSNLIETELPEQINNNSINSNQKTGKNRKITIINEKNL